MNIEEAKANPGLIVEIEFSVSWQRDPKKGAVARGQQSEDTLTLQSLINPEASEIIYASDIRSITSTGKYAFEPVLAKRTKKTIRDDIFDFADEIEKL